VSERILGNAEPDPGEKSSNRMFRTQDRFRSGSATKLTLVSPRQCKKDRVQSAASTWGQKPFCTIARLGFRAAGKGVHIIIRERDRERERERERDREREREKEERYPLNSQSSNQIMVAAGSCTLATRTTHAIPTARTEAGSLVIVLLRWMCLKRAVPVVLLSSRYWRVSIEVRCGDHGVFVVGGDRVWQDGIYRSRIGMAGGEGGGTRSCVNSRMGGWFYPM
jgi:hypothetical protein